MKDTHRLKLKGWKKRLANWNGEDGVAILISDKINCKTKAIIREKGHHIRIKGAIQQEDITLVNNYVPNTGASKYIRLILMDVNGEVDSNTVIAGTLIPHWH